MIPVFSSAYFPPVSYFALLSHFRECIIDPWEHYEKQSYRNRCEIYSPNGRQALSINIQKESGQKTPLKDIRIDYTYGWTKNHLRSLEAAYSSTAFYEYYIDELAHILEKEPVFLFDLNQSLLQHLLDEIGLEINLIESVHYLDNLENYKDYRASFHPKIQHRKGEPEINLPPYYQVFNQKYGYLPDLSVLDLLFNLGTETEIYLKKQAQFLTFNS